MGIKKAWRTYLLSIPRVEALAIAYQSRTDNVRAHADMKIIAVHNSQRQPYIGLHPAGHNNGRQGNGTRIDIVIPGASTVAVFKTLIV